MNPKDIEILTLIGNLCTGSGTFILAVTAIWGLGQWREQHRYKERFEVARKIVLLAFQFREEFKRARRLYVSDDEVSDRQKTNTETLDDAYNLNEQFARLKRIQILIRLAEKMNTLNWEASILLEGVNTDTHIKDIGDVIQELHSAVVLYFGKAYREARSKRQDIEEIEEHLRSKIYIPTDEGQVDKLGNRVEEITKTIVDNLRDYFR